jgi:ATP-dependent helicase HrpB
MTQDPRLGLDRLTLTPIARDAAEQRTGRAGRTQPGICIRLWSEIAHRARPARTEPEVRRVDLAGAVLQLHALGESDVRRFPWLEPPPDLSLTLAERLLRRLDAIDDRGITRLGRRLAHLPVHPRLGRLLVEGERLGAPRRAALAAALLSERDPFVRSVEAAARRPTDTPTSSDMLDRVEALEEFERRGRCDTPLGKLNRPAARLILRARDQLLRSLRSAGAAEHDESGEGLLRALLAAFPDRVARRREPGGRRGLMVGGRGARLAPSSGVLASELFVCLDVDAGQTDALVRLASTVRREWLPKDHVTTVNAVIFDADTERVQARRRVQLEDLVLEESAAAIVDEDEAAHVLAEAAAQRPERVLPEPDSPAGSFLTRVRCLRQWLPELGLPAFDETELRALLPWLCPGRRSFAELRAGPWLELLQGRLTHDQLQAVAREAPERLRVPSGSQLALRYEVGRPPVLAVRIQELFGLAETPRIAGGRARVLLHLLAPNHRPQQVTDDLASFWANTYAQVRKDLRARYPRHAWPEDPRNAPAESRPRRRGQ